MSYTPTEWKSGDIVTSEKLNKLETGVAGAYSGGSAPIVVNMVAGSEPGTAILDKTWQEIHDAGAGSIVFDTGNGIKSGPITTIYADESVPEYGIEAAIFNSSKAEWQDLYFVASSASAYPEWQIPET